MNKRNKQKLLSKRNLGKNRGKNNKNKINSVKKQVERVSSGENEISVLEEYTISVEMGNSTENNIFPDIVLEGIDGHVTRNKEKVAYTIYKDCVSIVENIVDSVCESEETEEDSVSIDIDMEYNDDYHHEADNNQDAMEDDDHYSNNIEVHMEDNDDEDCDPDADNNEETDKKSKCSTGRRVTDITEIENYGRACADHKCDNPDIIIQKEIVRRGLSSKFLCICRYCGEEVYKLQNSPDTYTDNNGKIRFCINYEAVLSQLTSGGSHNKLHSTLAFCGVPSMDKHTFIQLRNQIDDDAWLLSEEQMKIAGEMEKSHAIEMGHYWWDPKKKVKVPAICVYTDVAWSQISHHHHNMVARGSEIIIIGCFTGLPVYCSTRQKGCQECDHAEEAGIKDLPAEKHQKGKCYKNVPRNTSSKSMEPDLVFQGFSSSQTMHGVVYLWYVADGDTDLATRLRKLEYGNQIQHIPCCNHRVKNYRTELEKIAKISTRFETALGFTKAVRTGIAAGARTTMKLRSKEEEKILNEMKELTTDNEVKREELKTKLLLVKVKLKSDLKYGWRHKLGMHNKCSPDWCRVSAKYRRGEVEEDIYEDWNIPEASIIKGRAPTKEEKVLLFGKIQMVADRLAECYLGLLHNKSTNVCENKFSIRQSMLSKSLSTTRAGAFHTSVGLSALRLLLGPGYVEDLYKKSTSKNPPQYLMETITAIKRKANYSKDYQNREKTKKRRRYLKQRSSMVRIQSKLLGHGDVDDDLPRCQLIEKMKELIEAIKKEARSATPQNQNKSHVLQSEVSSGGYECATKELQHITGTGNNTKRTVFINQRENNEEWLDARDSLLTSSVFHRVVSKKGNTNVSATVEDIRYPRDLSSKQAIKWGVENEKVAVAELKKKMTDLLVIDNLGLFQNEEYPWLAATPDGLVCDLSHPQNQQWGTLEVKCPFSCKDGVPQDAKNLFSKTGKIKTNHPYSTQIQGQMGCIGVSYGLLVIWTPNDIYIEEIEFDSKQWEKSVQKLNTFYNNGYAPEVVDGRVIKGGNVRPWCFADRDIWNDDTAAA